MPDAAARRKFEALVAAAFADGFLSEAEKIVLQQKADQLGLKTLEMHEIIGLGQQRKLSIAIPTAAPERETLLDDLIDVCAADGRVEAPEYSLLARFAESLKLSLPDLRVRVNRRMQGLSDRNTRAQTRRESRPPPPPIDPRRVEPPPFPTVPESASSKQAPAPVSAPPPTPFHQEFRQEPKVGDLPPVTLQLLKQSIMFDNENDSIAAISRTLGIPTEPAAQIRQAILQAFPDLKPASGAVRQDPRR